MLIFLSLILIPRSGLELSALSAAYLKGIRSVFGAMSYHRCSQ